MRHRQLHIIRDLMIKAGHAHAGGTLRGGAQTLPHGPTMRERGGSVLDWVARLTAPQASDVLDALLAKAPEDDATVYRRMILSALDDRD